MVTVVLALVSSLIYGVSDFLGAVAARKMPVLAMTVLTYSAGTVALGLTLLVFPGEWSAESVLWGAIAGLVVCVGSLSFYAALAMGPVSILAPLIAVLFAVVPIAWALAAGEELSMLGWSGVAVGVIAVLALSIPPKGGAESDEERAVEPEDKKGAGPSPVALGLSVLAAVMLGLSVIALDTAPKTAGITPVFVELGVGVLILSIAFVFGKRPKRGEVPVRVIGTAVAAGITLAIANALLLLALQVGSLAIVTVLSALYPLSTIALAAIVLKEHVSKVQWLGVGMAIGAAVMLGLA